MEEQDVAPTVVLAPPTEKKIRMKSPSPGFRGRSQTPVRGRSMTPLMRFREKSEQPIDPSTWRSITPFLQREEKEKTSFEVGSNIIMQLASYKAIIDKALVMDISAEEEPPAKYIISEHSVIDRAAVMDISNVEIIYVEDDFEGEQVEGYESDGSSVRDSESRESSVMTEERPEGEAEEEEVTEKKKKKEKKVKKAPKKKEKKEKEASPPKLKLDLGGPPPPKVNKAKLFEQQQKAAAEAKPPPKKSGKLAGALAAMQAQETAAKEAELQRQQIEEKMKQMKEEQASKQQNGDEEENGEGEGEGEGEGGDGEERGSQEGSEYGGSGYNSEDGNGEEQEGEGGEEAEGEENSEGESGAETESSVENFTRPDNDYGEWDKYDDQQGVIRSKYERKKHKKMSERERDIEFQKAREAARYPRIHAHLKDVAIEEGHSIKLTTTVSGPELNIKWLKDGHPLEKSPKYRVLVNEGIVSLEILRTLPSDSGEYSCKLSNNNGDASTTAIVTIYDVIKDDPTPPTFTFVRDYYHLNEDVLGIEVHCTGTPRPKVTWIRDMVEIVPSYKHTLLEEAHGVYKMEIYKPSFKDNGKYVCRAENVMAEEEICHKVEFIGKPKHFHMRGLHHAHNELLKVKEEAAKRAMEEALRAKEEYEMRRTGQLPARSRADPELKACSQKDRLKFATQLRDRTAIVGNKVKFTVSVLGPDPNIRWFKDGNPLVYGPSIRNSTADGMSIVEMTHLTADQTGEYKCHARNDFSEVSTSCYLKIYDAKVAGDKEAPLFVLSIRDVYNTRENDLVIDCKVRGNPRPIIVWAKDELPIEFDERTQQIEHGDGLCELIINKPTIKDSGTYTCTAANNIGSQKSSHKVEFIPSPSSRRDSGMPSETASDSGKGKGDAAGVTTGAESGAESSAAGGKPNRPPRGSGRAESKAPEVVEYTSRRPAAPTMEELLKSARSKLSFVTHLTNRLFAEGSKIKLSCVIQGPDPNIRWLKDENPIVYSQRVKNVSRDGLCVLEIDKCTPDDAGEYSLVVRNPDSNISSSCTLQVYAAVQTSDFAPTFTRAPKHTYHLNTNEIYLETHVRGQPHPKVEWVKDGVTVSKEDSKYTQIDHPDGTCELIVNYPRPNDSGKYVVKAENRAGQCSVQHIVSFEGKEAHIVDNRHRVYHSDPVHLAKAKSDKAHQNGVAQAQPEPEEEQGKGKGRGRGSKGTGSAQNTRTESSPAPEPVAVQTYTRQKEPPRESKKVIYFASKLSDRVVAEGSKIKLTCYLDGQDPSIRWLKDDQPVVYSAKIRQSNNNGVCSLEFTAVCEADSGVYKCYARNTTGEVTTAAKLEVFPNPGSPDSPPTFTRSLKDTYHTQLNEIKLSCHCRGLPTPAITWTKDAVTIEPSEKYQIVDKDDGTCELTVNFATKQDNGKYVCRGENRAGQTDITHIVQLQQLKDASSLKLPPPHPAAAAADSAETNGVNGENGVNGVDEKDGLPPNKRGRGKGKGERESSVASSTATASAPERAWVSRYHETPIDPKTKLHFAAFLTDRTIAEGGKTKLSAYVEGPDPNVKWLKDENPITLGSNCRSQLRDGLVTLDLSQLKSEDSGVYKLICRNQSGEINCSCRLMVYEVIKEEVIPPLFTMPIKDSYHAHSNQLILECKVHGDPNPTIDWYKNGVKLTKNQHISFKENIDGVRQLIITDPDWSDNGSYKCEATNSTKITEINHIVDISDRMKNGSKELDGLKKKIRESKQESEEAKLEFRQKLIFESFLKNVTVSEGNVAKFICSVRGPDADVVWMKDGTPIRRNSRLVSSVNDGLVILEIPDAKSSDSGEYTCLVKNSKSEITTTARLNVYDRSNEKLNVPPSFSRSLRESYDAVTNELVLDCIVRGHPKIHWFKDNYNISSNRYTPIEEIGGIRRLIIKDPVSSDFGCFTCRAEENNQIDEISLRVSNTDYVTPIKPKDQTDRSIGKYSDRTRSRSRIQDRKSMSIYSDETLYRDAKRKPIFSTELMDRTAAENSTIKLTCNVIGIDTSVRWFRNSLPLDISTRYVTRLEDGLATLEIFSARPDDTAEYTCVARNPFGELSSSAYLKVYQGYELSSMAPIFTRPMKDTYNLISDELVLECRVRGSKPNITWMKDNDFIESNEKYQQFDQADGYCKLIINSPEEKDSGLYICKAENAVSSDKVTHKVVFTGRDAYILEKTHGYFHRDINKPHFQNSIGDHMITQGGVIALQADILHGPVDVQWYRDHSQILPTGKVQAFQDHGVHTLIIPDAKYEVSGTYTCVASNAFGKVESVGHIHIVGPSVKGGKCPLFQSRPETEMLIMTGDPFSLSFRIIGEPKPKLIFMKGLKDITQSDRVLKETQDDYIRFTVQRSNPMDSGTYWIIARNEHGSDRAFVTITVKQRARSITPSYSSLSYPIDDFADVSYLKNPPDPISSEPICVDSGRNHISLTWGKSHKINSAPVLAYKVEAWLIGIDGGARWQELGVTPINSFDAFNLRSGCEYHFRVTPKNRYGWGKSVQTSSAILMGGAQCLPEFTKILPGQLKALSGMDFTLECSVKGIPKPAICWYRDGVQIRQNDQVSIRQFGSICRLTIKEITEKYSGRFSCEATNCQGRVSTFARLQVVTDPRVYAADSNLKRNIDGDLGTLGDMIPQFTMRLRERRIQVTYPVRLTCQAVGWPTPLITWYKDNVEIEQNDRIKTFHDGQFNTLEISKTTLSDTGTYTASAKNESGEVSCHCNLYVDKGIRGYIAPEFYCTFNPVYNVKSGHEIRISGQIEAYPTVGVTWHRDGIRLRPSRRVTATLDQEGFVELVIADATKWDAGVYTCIASNAVGVVESSCRVVVDELDEENKIKVPDIRLNVPYSKEPMFVTKPRSTQAFEGDTVIIYCEVIGDPKPDVVWLRDFLKPDYYKDAPHFRRIGDGPEYRLEIPYAKLDFTGTYSVIATNCYGEAKAIISLQIYAKDLNKSNAMNRGGSIKHGNVETLPIFTRPLKDLRCCDGDSITLECHVEAQPEPTVIWEKDGRVLPHSNDFRTNFCDDRATLSISRVFPEDEGEYTCVASNNIGKSYTSACIIVDVPEEKENLISRILARPSGLLSATSTPRSTPRTTPARSISPMPLSYRSTHIDLSTKQHKCAAPKFYAMPHNRLAEEGETVRFQCAIAGHPTPWSTWDKDGIIVTPTTRLNIKERDDLRALEIEEVTMEDAGLYRITLENEYGRIEATARLDVISNKRSSGHGIRTSASPRRSISSTRRIMGNSTRIGGRLALACNFRGGSVPNKKFYHNGTELPPTDRVKVIENNEISCLLIDNVQAEDEGVYTCVANNESGIAATSTIVTFSESQDHTAPEFIRGLGKTIQAKESYVLDLVCSVVCSDPFEMEWLRDGAVIPDSDDFRYIDHGEGMISLRILDPFVFDSGRYTCIVRSDYGKCETSCDVVVSEVSEQDEFEMKPVFIKSPQTVVAAYGTVVSFCARVSPVHAKMEWSVCGRVLTEDTRGILIEHQPDGVHILHILGLEYKHSGEIKCVAYIPTQPDSAETTVFTDLVVLPTASPTVTVETNPSEQPELPAYIIRGPEDCSVLIGGTVTLEAIFGGYSQPKVKWYRAGRQITESTNIKIQTTPGHSSLLLTNITADQSGKYTIEIMNEHSCDISSASVSVEGPPEPPGGRPSVSQGSDRLSIAWCGPPFDGGVMITGYILEIQEENNEWIEYSTVVDSLATTIKDLKPGVAYRFRVRAENVHGRSVPSAESDEVRISLGTQVQAVFDDDVTVKPGGDFKTRFTLQEELGKGRFGVVHKVIENENGRVLAAKIVKCIKAMDKQKIQEEISIMQSLRHPKLLQLAAAFENPREMIMVMEFITGGELFERVVADDFTLTERDCILFLRQICEGVDYMHYKSVVHLDLKPENIMCHNRTSHQIKIIDFGLAQRITSDTPVRVLFGTPEFIPPEIINYEPIGFQSDMWSIGVICYVLLSGLSPFMGESDVDTFSNITCADFDFDDDSFDAVSQDAKDFISSLLVHRKEKRLTAKQCLESKWLSDKNAKLSTAKICTDKLKKFVIRRKWQKTGNAIRALGRMATLSANSRRNSAASASVPNSPRPSITGSLTTTPMQRMSSLNEEEDHSVVIPPTNPPVTDMKSKSKSCNERSDSGFSECSNCSEKIPCVCSHQPIDKNLVIAEEKQVDEDEAGQTDTKLSHEILQLKLEEIADTQMDDDQATSISHSSSIASIHTSSTSRNGSDIQETKRSNTACLSDIKISITSETPTKPNLSRSSSVEATSPVDKGPIMRSDFTNTINMRKQWLEQNAHKEKPAIGPVTRTLIEGTGKVSKLKQRFSLEKMEIGNNESNGNTVSTFVRSNQSSMTPANNKRAVDRLSNSLTDHSNSTKLNINLDERNSYAKSIETRSPLRLDGRVREASSRLTTSTSNNDTIKRNGGISPNGKNNESFKKAAAFWKG